MMTSQWFLKDVNDHMIGSSEWFHLNTDKVKCRYGIGQVLTNAWVKVENPEKPELNAGGHQGPQWVQGNALARGPGGRRPPEAPEF